MPEALLTTDIDRRAAGKFVMGKLLPSGKAKKTTNRIISSLSSFWKWTYQGL